MKVSDYICKYLSLKDVDTCFSVTGGGAMHLNDSFGHSEDFSVIYNHHEQACAIAAEGYARVKLKPAAVCVTSGPGAVNALSGVFGAWLDSIPMIIISGQMKSQTILKSTPVPVRYLGFQEADIIPLAKKFTKYATSIDSLKDLDYHLDKAFFNATTGRKGPVWLDIPLDIQGLELVEAQGNEPKFVPGLVSDNVDLASEKVDAIIQFIGSAKKPILMLGEEVRISGAYHQIQNLIIKLKIPVVTEWNAHDLVDHTNPYYCGRPGTIGDRGGNYVVQNSDLVIAIGCQLSIRQISYEWKNFAKNAKLICVNTDENEIQKPTIKVDYPVVCNVNRFAEAMCQSTVTPAVMHLQWLEWCQYIHQKYPIVLDRHYNIESPVNVYPIMKAISNQLPEKSTVVLANGAACVCGLQALEIRNGLRVFTNAGASSMGYGIAAAVGAAIANRDKNYQTICIEGDGSIMMNLQELQTIVGNKLDIKIFIINNGGYQSIKQTQRNLFSAEKRGYCGATSASGLSLPDFSKIAHAFGMPYMKICDTSKIKSTIDMFFSLPSFGVCEIFSDPNQDFEPKLASKILDDGSFLTAELDNMSPFLPEHEHNINQFDVFVTKKI